MLLGLLGGGHPGNPLGLRESPPGGRNLAEVGANAHLCRGARVGGNSESATDLDASFHLRVPKASVRGLAAVWTAGWLLHGGLGDEQVAFHGIKGCADAEGQGGVQRDVAEGQTHHDGDFQGEQSFPEHVFQGLAVFFGVPGIRLMAVGIDADGNARDLLEQPGVEQLGQHPVEAVRHFVQVFEEEDTVLERGLIRGPERATEQGDVAADQRAGDDTAAQDGDGLALVAVRILPGGEGCIRVLRKLCSVKSGKLFLTKSELSIGP